MMNNTDDNFLPFSKPSLDQATIDEVVACVKSGWLATGPRVKRFEKAVQEYLKVPYALALTSATSGLKLALKSAGIKPGDEIITSPMTFVASLNTIVHVGARPVLVDVDPDTRNIAIDKIEAAITERTRGIMPVHFAGIPVDLDPLYDLAKKYNLRVIEDAAHAIGSHYKNRIIGSFGDIQVFSFHPNKVMTTGEGGLVATRDARIAKSIASLRFHGIDREIWNRNTKEGSHDYDVIEPGFKCNMLDLQAAIGIHQLASIEKFIARRAELADRYQEHFSSWSELTLPKAPSYAHRNSWYIYAPLINKEKAGFDRNTFMEMMKANNIGTGHHHKAAHLYDFYQNRFGYRHGQFPNAEAISDNIVSIPLFPDMTLDDQNRVINAMRKIFKK